MPNPIMSMLRTPSKSTSTSKSTNFPDVSKMSFAEFARYMKGKDAKSMVDDLRASGQMSEQQYQKLLAQAQSNMKNVQDFLK